MSIVHKLKEKIRWYLFGGKQQAEAFAIQRTKNQLHSYDFPSECNGWKKYDSKPVYGDSKTGTIFDPYVILHNENFSMVASERKTGNLLLLVSNDGINWSYKNTILVHRRKTWENIVNRGCLLYVRGVWHLWYTGQYKSKSSIGHAISFDGRVFTRSVNNPVLTSTLSLEGISVMNPCVLWDEVNEVFRMWYSAGENYEPDLIFYAESNDGDVWTKREKPVLSKCLENEWEKYKVGGCDVKRQLDGTYVIYYIGYQNLDVARICIAHSKDGINWVRPENNLLISPTKGSWDANATYKPTVVEKNGIIYMWYNGRRDQEEYIGLATKNL